jgi:hypothetical protein
MMYKATGDKRRTLAGFMFLLFCSYTISLTCFVHSHIVDGRRITHSHPYKGVPDNPGHGHTAAQFIAIDLLSHFETLSATFAGLLFAVAAKIIIRQPFRIAVYRQIQIRYYALRAPPVAL